MEITSDDHVYSFFPWQQGEKPYFISEEGYEWYVDKFATKYAHQDSTVSATHSRTGCTDLFAFYVKKGNTVKSILINRKQDIIAERDNSIALMNVIDIIKINRDFSTSEEIEVQEESDSYQRQVIDFIQ